MPGLCVPVSPSYSIASLVSMSTGWVGSANSPLQASLHQEGVGGMDDAAAGGLSTAFGPMLTRFDAFAAHNAAA